METLFPMEQILPEGFLYIPGFLSEQEEQDLLAEISSVELHTFTFQGYEAKRKVKSFGYNYHFNNRSVSRGDPIPPGFQPLIQKVSNEIPLSSSEFAELLVTEYPAGSLINWHRDAPPFGLIAGIYFFLTVYLN